MTWRGAVHGVYFVIAIALIGTLLAAVLPLKQTTAAQITSRSLTLEAGSSAGGSDPGGVVKHYFQFTVPSSTAVQSIQFDYCTTASGTCTAPTGMSSSGASIAGPSSGLTSFSSLNTTTTNAPYISSASAVSVAGSQAITLSNITNPTTANYTFYVRISTFTSNNASGTPVDSGTVAASTANPIVLTGTMPESLVFCTGGTVGETNSIPDCTTATSGSIQFNQLFSPTATATAESQMAASTNATTGYVISVNGTTMTNGSYTISAMSSAAASQIGTGQFGLNLNANTLTSANPNAFGSALTPTSDGVNYKGEAITGYNTTNEFQFNSGDTIANSADGGAGPTDAQIYTVSYIVNVPGNQIAGTYSTTLTYICTPTY